LDGPTKVSYQKPSWFVYPATADTVVKKNNEVAHGDVSIITLRTKSDSRGLVRFDDFSNGKQIISASLSLVVTDVSPDWPQPFGSSLSVYRMKSDWEEDDVTGKCSEDDCNPGWLYGKDSDAYDHYPTDTVPVSDTLTPAGSTISFNVTEDVQGMIEGGWENYGWMVAKTVARAGDDGVIAFCTKENDRASECTPKLVIEYGGSSRDYKDYRDGNAQMFRSHKLEDYDFDRGTEDF